ncbi:membrane protein-like protein [Methanohalobium evestigatum Z-7303]|uniref:Membrane protein-like protein n=1 Tax=Methanohalobium evestigatum (strain ATCC BAA-1072 / DSM 3721 / NBRC 107634 / OCM 161 / Z-7303) TaxID=644295 RepID=D7E747_METEZ|nr:DUF2070 family protein [Methanohalobium evestigatum]ADI73671.1 membrane protein-like protein [Methanohalobium evestigatum Z-7303]
MSDNIDVFKNIIFSVPSLKRVVEALIVTGAIYGVLINLSISYLSAVPLNLYYIIITALFMFIIPALVSGELYYQFLPEYPRKWGYFLTLFNEFVLFVYGMILTFSAESGFISAWNIFWIAIITIFLTSLLVLVGTLGYKYIKRISILGMVQPLMIVSAFHLSIGKSLEITVTTYIERIGLLFLAGIMLLLTFFLAEYLISTNVNVSAIKLSSGLLQKRQEVLNLGYSSRPDVQTLEIENENSSTTIAVPWIHPGPLEGFGGGRASTDLINHLNENGSGFFFHVPSTHKCDPVNPDDIYKIIKALNKPTKSSTASKLVKESYPEHKLTFYGRKLGDKKLVYMEAENYGDYEISVFRDLIDLENVMIIDLHNHERNKEPDPQLLYGTDEAEIFREKLLKFLDKLEGLKTSDYQVGYCTNTIGTPKFALIENVDGQKTLLFGTEGNGISEKMDEVRQNLKDSYDEILIFTTDTHSSIHNMISNKHVETDELYEVINKASKNVSNGSAGFTNNKSESMKLLKDDYLGLAYSINILVRLFPLSLLLLYIVLILWIL